MRLRLSLCITVFGAWLAGCPHASGIEPADPGLIPEARAVLDYLESIYGKQSLAGGNRLDASGAIEAVSGKAPAIVTIDLSGWNTPTWGKTYAPVVEKSIENAKAVWAKGSLLTMQFHWKHPGKPDGTAWVGKHGKNPPSGPFDMAAACQKGSEPNRQFMGDLAKHADYLQRLADARIPVLWRPFHEIDGGWFWWTDKEKPENTAAVWRMMFDFLVKERGLHNLIWVYNAGLRPGGYVQQVKAAQGTATIEGEIAFRKRYYPGDAYVDISGIDIYPNESAGYGKPSEDAYQKAFDIMSQVSPGKMLALSECEAIPNPDIMAKDGPKWLYCLPWWGPGQRHPEEWVKTTYPHTQMVTRDELPQGLVGKAQDPR